MLQRMNAGASRKKHRGSRRSTKDHDSLIDYSYITSIEAPKVGKVDHHSIELSWTNLNETDVHGDNRLKYELQEENNQKEYRSVYIGFADCYKVDGLCPLRSYKFRLIVSANDQQLATSPVACGWTSDEPYDSEQLHKAVTKNDPETILKIINSKDVGVDSTDRFGLTPLMVATQKGYDRVVDLLLELGADPYKRDSSGKSSLMFACFGARQTIAKRLVSAGLEWDECDRSGSTPLHYAVDSGNSDFIDWVVRDGAPIERKDTTSGWTPLLRCAATTGDHDSALALLDSGANPNVQDNSGKSALMMSCLNGHLRLTVLLLERGANINLKSSHGKTCMDMAASFDRTAIISCLETSLETAASK